MTIEGHAQDSPSARRVGIDRTRSRAGSPVRGEYLRELLVLDLGEHIREFRDVDIKSLTESALKRWVKWATGVEATLERGIVILRAGQALLTAGNLDPLVQTLTTSDEKKQFRAFLQALSSRVPSGDPERNNRESARDS